LYSCPATEFTATFLGDTNLINGTVKGLENDLVTLDTPLGTLVSSAWAGDVPPSGAVRCSIRPEAITPGVAGANQFQAAAMSSVFLGERVRYSLKAANDLLVEASIARPDTAMISEEASTFAIDPAEIVIIGD
ncbi:MAG: TOBE domain-containing protein, partial [Phycisphaerales bacterium]|nr:TOBE domain-containing protein [Phycisphaerales bacterium]